ncbi:hypothetical protein [Actinomadura macrotermitis]|uniref:Uncharacterized protein n=1 Tax=Actinomadura macrotermitis TaxID=2585200 RepID=A0A7K0BZZ3_9ACTN|nr:hypothetical protein [Actinomadura macrotermitis]MQY06757.1 hypothetical protein [Actinomadura macrotermitis]
MQLPRVIIAAVFFVIGVLIAIPPLIDWTSESKAAGTTSPSPSASGSAPASPGASPSGGKTPTARPSTSHTPGRPASPSPGTSSPKPPTTAPVQPLTITIGQVRCPARKVDVTVRNSGSRSENYAIERDDDSAATPGTIAAGASRTTTLTLREDRRTRLQVTWKNEPVMAKTLTANCKHRSTAAPAPTRKPTKLPHTGPDNALLWARAATGGAAMITGLIIIWYGGIWPRRREQVFGRKGGE